MAVHGMSRASLSDCLVFTNRVHFAHSLLILYAIYTDTIVEQFYPSQHTVSHNLDVAQPHQLSVAQRAPKKKKNNVSVVKDVSVMSPLLPWCLWQIFAMSQVFSITVILAKTNDDELWFEAPLVLPSKPPITFNPIVSSRDEYAFLWLLHQHHHIGDYLHKSINSPSLWY